MPPDTVNITSMVRGDGTVNVADVSQPTNQPSELFKAVVLDAEARQDGLKKSEQSRQDALKRKADQSLESVRKRHARQFATAVAIKNAEGYLEFKKRYCAAWKAMYDTDKTYLRYLRRFWAFGESQWGANIVLLEEDLQYRAALQGLDPEAFVYSNRQELGRLEADIAEKERDLLQLKAQYNKGDEQSL